MNPIPSEMNFALLAAASVNYFLKTRRIAYFITDRNQVVLLFGGDSTLVPDQQAVTGQVLTVTAPELIGMEEELTAILAGRLPGVQLTLVHREDRSGQAVYVNLITLPYGDTTGKVMGLVHIVEDISAQGITEQLMAQQRNELLLLRDQLATQNMQLTAMNAELRRTDEVRSRFVSGASHELRTPLASIIGYTQLLQEDNFKSLHVEQHSYLDVVLLCAYRLLEITDNLLDVTRIDSGRMELLLKPIDLTLLVECVLTELLPQLLAKQHLLDWTSPSTQSGGAPGLPLVLCDETRSLQILGNLVGNAIKYTPEGGTITVRLQPAPEAGFLLFSVADTGIGIPAKDQSNLFTSFFRASNAHEARVNGAGLGLSITRSLVELQGGHTWFISEAGKGSIFYATFPIADDWGS